MKIYVAASLLVAPVLITLISPILLKNTSFFELAFWNMVCPVVPVMLAGIGSRWIESIEFEQLLKKGKVEQNHL